MEVIREGERKSLLIRGRREGERAYLKGRRGHEKGGNGIRVWVYVRMYIFAFSAFDAVGWAAGKASGL